LLLKLLAVMALSAIEIWAAIPAGIALSIHPVLTGLAVSGGAILSTFMVIFAGGRLRTWLLKRHTKKDGGKNPGLISRIWQRFGITGLGLLAPLLTGAPLGAALGLALGAPSGRLMLWMSIGIVLWTAILITAASIGWAGIESLR
jgi:hypothetical protein